MEYFRLFGLEPRWNPDLQDLERRFYALSRSLHPDVYARGSPQERRAALDASARLNDAYRILKDPTRRAEYLLAQHGVGEAKSPELLEEVFEWNLEVEELRAEADPGKLAAAQARFASLRSQAEADLAEKFEQADRTGKRAVLEEIRTTLHRRKYLQNLLQELAATEHA